MTICTVASHEDYLYTLAPIYYTIDNNCACGFITSDAQLPPSTYITRYPLASTNKKVMESTKSIFVLVELAIAQQQPMRHHSILYTSEWLESSSTNIMLHPDLGSWYAHTHKISIFSLEYNFSYLYKTKQKSAL